MICPLVVIKEVLLFKDIDIFISECFYCEKDVVQAESIKSRDYSGERSILRLTNSVLNNFDPRLGNDH